MKICTHCKNLKSTEEFGFSSCRINQLESWCKECNNRRTREWYRNNKHKFKDYYKKNAIKIAARSNAYHRAHKIERNARNRRRRKSDLQFRLASNLRQRLRAALKGNARRGSAVRDLGCPIGGLKQHLEVLWQPGMCWDNYGNKKSQWSIDHICPLTFFDLTDREQLLKACHYSNLQPLWQEDNLRKSDKWRGENQRSKLHLINEIVK